MTPAEALRIVWVECDAKYGICTIGGEHSEDPNCCGRIAAFRDKECSGEAICIRCFEYLSKEPTKSEAAERKARPVCTGVLDYFPLALEAVAICSRVGNEQHNPGQPLHWAKDKSTDHADALLRHLIDRGKVDTDGVLHSAKVAWRALALLQTELEKAAK